MKMRDLENTFDGELQRRSAYLGTGVLSDV